MSNEGVLWLLVDAGKARKQGQRAIARGQRDRLVDLVAIARTGSSSYRQLGHVTIDCAAEPPVMSPGGNYRSFVPMN